MLDRLLGDALPFVFYILGSLCFLAGSAVTLWRMLR